MPTLRRPGYPYGEMPGTNNPQPLALKLVLSMNQHHCSDAHLKAPESNNSDGNLAHLQRLQGKVAHLLGATTFLTRATAAWVRKCMGTALQVVRDLGKQLSNRAAISQLLASLLLVDRRIG